MIKSRFFAVVTVLIAAGAAGRSLAADAPHPGKMVFDRWCGGCHWPAKPDDIGRFGPSIPAGTKVLGERYGTTRPAPLEQRADLSPELIKIVVRNGIGFMPFFRKTEVSDGQLEQVAAYLARSGGARE